MNVRRWIPTPRGLIWHCVQFGRGRLLGDWRGLLGHVGTSRQVLRKLLNSDAGFVFYPRSEDGERWYELSVTPEPGQVPRRGAVTEKSGGAPKGMKELLHAQRNGAASRRVASPTGTVLMYSVASIRVTLVGRAHEAA